MVSFGSIIVLIVFMLTAIMMKSDVLDSFETIKACVAYELPDEPMSDYET